MNATLISFLSFVFVIVQQPIGDPFFVSLMPNEITQYARAYTYCESKSIGLLADEYLAGVQVRQLTVDDMITVTFTDHIEHFRVTETLRYIAYQPYVVQQDAGFKNIDTGEVLTSFDLGIQIYCGDSYHLAIQTCFDNTLGRFFVLADLVSSKHERMLRSRK